MRVSDHVKVRVTGNVFPYMVVLQYLLMKYTNMQWKYTWIQRALEIGQRSALMQKGILGTSDQTGGSAQEYISEISTRTGTNNESSCVRPEDGSQRLPQALTRTARVSNSRVSKWDIARLYKDAVWRIRTLIRTFRAIPQTMESTQNPPKSSLLISGYRGTLVWP